MKTEKKILLVDMDGVVANFKEGIFKVEPSLSMLDSNFDIEEHIVDEIVSKDFNFFQNLEPIDGSIEAVKELMKHYHVYFCSTPMENVPHSFTGKKEWLDLHFDDKAYKNLILTHRKDLCLGDYLIDDRKTNGVDKFTGEHIHFKTDLFPDWNSVLKYLIK